MKITTTRVIGAGLLLLGSLCICNSCSNNPTAVEDQTEVNVIDTTLIDRHPKPPKWKVLQDSIDVLNGHIIIMEFNKCVQGQMMRSLYFRIDCLLSQVPEGSSACPGLPINMDYCSED